MRNTFIELTDQDEQLISCGIDMGSEGKNIATEILDQSEVSSHWDMVYMGGMYSAFLRMLSDRAPIVER